jgi:hypothetical protein
MVIRAAPVGPSKPAFSGRERDTQTRAFGARLGPEHRPACLVTPTPTAQGLVCSNNAFVLRFEHPDWVALGGLVFGDVAQPELVGRIGGDVALDEASWTGALIPVTSLVFALTVVTLQIASTQVSPRLQRRGKAASF